MRYDSRQGAMVDDLAKVTMSEDQMLYYLCDQTGVTFHTGKTLTADDVYFTYHDIIQSEEFSNSVLRANFSGVAITKKMQKPFSFNSISQTLFHHEFECWDSFTRLLWRYSGGRFTP